MWPACTLLFFSYYFAGFCRTGGRIVAQPNRRSNYESGATLRARFHDIPSALAPQKSPRLCNHVRARFHDIPSALALPKSRASAGILQIVNRKLTHRHHPAGLPLRGSAYALSIRTYRPLTRAPSTGPSCVLYFVHKMHRIFWPFFFLISF